jgi:hypothetical protein
MHRGSDKEHINFVSVEEESYMPDFSRPRRLYFGLVNGIPIVFGTHTSALPI